MYNDHSISLDGTGPVAFSIRHIVDTISTDRSLRLVIGLKFHVSNGESKSVNVRYR